MVSRLVYVDPCVSGRWGNSAPSVPGSFTLLTDASERSQSAFPRLWLPPKTNWLPSLERAADA
jgi:hypothetical protein